MKTRVGILPAILSVLVFFTAFFAIAARAQDSSGSPTVLHEIKRNLSPGSFWYSQEYMQTTGSFNWSTRIASFKFNSCR